MKAKEPSFISKAQSHVLFTGQSISRDVQGTIRIALAVDGVRVDVVLSQDGETPVVVLEFVEGGNSPGAKSADFISRLGKETDRLLRRLLSLIDTFHGPDCPPVGIDTSKPKV